MGILLLLKTPSAIAAGLVTLVLSGSVTAICLTVAGSGKAEDVSPPTKTKRYNHILLQEGIVDGSEEQITKGNQIFKCKLEDGSHISLCALSKVVEPEGKSNNWVDYKTFKNLDTDPEKIEGFITEDKTVYKAKISSNLIDEWAENQDKKLNIYDVGADITAATKPLTTVIPKFAVKDGDVAKGMSKYLLAKVNFLEVMSDDGPTSLETSGKYFKCSALYGGWDYSDCDIYYFDENDEKGKEFDSKALKTSLKRADLVSEGLHYLIKFDKAQKIETTKFAQSLNVNLRVFNDASRLVEPTSGIKGALFEHLSHVVMMGDDEDSVDLALIL